MAAPSGYRALEFIEAPLESTAASAVVRSRDRRIGQSFLDWSKAI